MEFKKIDGTTGVGINERKKERQRTEKEVPWVWSCHILLCGKPVCWNRDKKRKL